MRAQDTDWYKTRPAFVQRRIDAYPPGKPYRMRTTGQIVRIFSYAEYPKGACSTCTVSISPEENTGMLFERRVFGVDFADLEAMP